MTQLATYCDITPEILTRKSKMQRVPVLQAKTYNIGDFHKDLEKSTKESKKSVIDVLCKMLSTHGDFTDFGEQYPEAYKRLQEMRGR